MDGEESEEGCDEDSISLGPPGRGGNQAKDAPGGYGLFRCIVGKF